MDGSAINRGRRRVPAVTALLTALALIAAACGPDSDPGGAGTSTPSSALADPNTQVAVDLPENAVEAAVARLDGLVAGLMSSTGIPGLAVAVVAGGQTKYAKGFGVADVATGAKVDADTVFPLASMSKPIGATVIAHCVSDGSLPWDLPVATGLPGFTLADPYVGRTVTVADMYAHRSGLPDHAGDKLESMGYDRAQVLTRLRHIPLDPFRITYNYTNFGVTAGAEAVAHRLGTDWESLSQRMIYGPLGMTRTSSRFADFAARDNRVVGHVKVDGRWVVTPAQRDPDAQSPAGGVSASLHDLTHWLSMLLADGKYQGRQIISPDALRPAITPQIVSAPAGSSGARAGFYGYGFNVSVTEAGRTEYSHSGAFSMGAATNFAVLPSADVAIVVLSNAAPIGAVETLTGEFIDLVQFGRITHDWRALYGRAFAAMDTPSGSLVGAVPPSNPAAAQPLSGYVGTYDNSLYGPAQVRERNGGLVLALGPDGSTVHELTHWDANTFTFRLRDENAEAGSISKVTFEGGRMTVEYYADDANNGVFVRR